MITDKIAVLGYGVVGSGVVDVMMNHQDSMAKITGHNVEVKYILDIVEHKNTGFDDKFISDFNIILNDSEISTVAEVIGGVKVAYTFTKQSLEAGKNVVTSNKELVATKGAELLKIAKEHNVKYLFEASVGGGIPIIRPLRYCLIGNNITKIAGIVNGTTNFILTKMFEEKMPFDEALSLAQKLGYAEREPSADIEGHDACRKICILSSLISGKHIYPEEVYTKGITEITSDDVNAANSLGYTIKLIAYCKTLENCKMNILVSPMLVESSSRLSSIKDVFNGLVVDGDSVNEVAFYGPGAGKLPTASAVVSDIMECTRLSSVNEPVLWEDNSEELVIDHNDGKFSFFVRANKNEKLKEKITSLLKLKVDIKGINNQYVFITDIMSEKDFNNAIDELNKCGLEILSSIRVLD